jgi:hypothetical protein
VDGSKGGILIGRTHGELIAIELAQTHHPGLGEAIDHRGIERASVVGENAAARRRDPVTRDQNVLVRDRHTLKGAGLMLGDAGVRSAGLGDALSGLT